MAGLNRKAPGSRAGRHGNHGPSKKATREDAAAPPRFALPAPAQDDCAAFSFRKQKVREQSFRRERRRSIAATARGFAMLSRRVMPSGLIDSGRTALRCQRKPAAAVVSTSASNPNLTSTMHDRQEAKAVARPRAGSRDSAVCECRKPFRWHKTAEADRFEPFGRFLFRA